MCKVECRHCHTFVIPIYGGECPNCGEDVSGFDPYEALKERQEEYNRDYAYLKSKGMTDEEIEEILDPDYEYEEDWDEEDWDDEVDEYGEDEY